MPSSRRLTLASLAIVATALAGCGREAPQGPASGAAPSPAAPTAAASVRKPALAPAPDTEVRVYGLDTSLRRYSPLEQIDTGNVDRLVPVWAAALGDLRGLETQPLVLGGRMYVTTHNATFALDARTGRQIWKSAIDYPPETVTCCGIVNRGLATDGERLYRVTLDARVQALSAADGKLLWEARAADIADGYSMTGAPLLANGVLITGIAGGEFGVRGFLDGWDPGTGEHLWRLDTIPEPGEPGHETWQGDSWKRGGAPTWLTGSYDPELDLVYWGTGNPGPWNARARGAGDHLYTNCMLAVRPKTGERVWYFQFSPRDTFDYDGVNEPVLADIEVDGQPRKVLMQANRNGFFYVLDRTNGELIAANQFIEHLTWATHVDMATGRPVWSEATHAIVDEGKPAEIWPSPFGGKNVAPMSYSPRTGLVYANTFEVGWKYTPVKPKYRPGVFYTGVLFEWRRAEGPDGYLRAIEPLTGKARWQVPSEIPMNGGTLVTAGDLVFTGAHTGELMAFDARDGKKLWQFQTGSGIVAPPITWAVDGRQYVTVASGIGGVYANFGGDERLKNVNPGATIWTFALFDR